MSRRFGRNQKRRMREEIAQAQRQAETSLVSSLHAANMRREAENRTRELQEYMDEFAQTVGRYALAAGEPTRFDADWLQTGQKNFRMMVPLPPMYVFSQFDRNERKPMLPRDMAVEIMRLLEVEAIHSEASRDMHCMVSFDDIQIGYAISDHALRIIPEPVLVEKIAREMKPLLAEAIHKLKGKS